MSKYHSRKTIIDGIVFDSRKEANYYCDLKLLKRAGTVTDFRMQVEFVLVEGFRDRHKKYYRPIKYYADFVVEYADGHTEVIDVKGYRTKEYLLKRKLLLSKYPDMDFREI